MIVGVLLLTLAATTLAPTMVSARSAASVTTRDEDATFATPDRGATPPSFLDRFLAADDAERTVTTAEAGGRSITVTPDTDLVDGQAVTVEGTGFTDVSFVGIVQCARGLGIDGCDISTAAPSFDFVAGAFSEQYFVEALLDTEAGPIDCRTYQDGCRIMVNEQFALPGSARATTDFDPAGPLEPSPTVSVDPDADLVDGQVVHVTGTGFRPDEEVLIVQCPTGTPDPTSTCGGHVTYEQVDGSGTLSADFEVQAVFTPILGPVHEAHDCRTDPCDIGVAASEDYERFGAATVAFDPDAPLRPEMEVTVTPHTGLVDGQVVQLDGAGYTPDGPVDVVECSISSALDGSGCELDRVQHLTADADGSVTTTYAVNDVLDTEVGEVDCRRSTCILVAVDRSVPIDIGRGYRFENLQFAGGDPIDPAAPAAPTSVSPAFTG
jgi:hypothetical protein